MIYLLVDDQGSKYGTIERTRAWLDLARLGPYEIARATRMCEASAPAGAGAPLNPRAPHARGCVESTVMLRADAA